MKNPVHLLNKDERTLVERISTFHEKDGRFSAACLVGSLAKGYFSQTSDIDLMILSDVENFELELFAPILNEMRLDATLKDDAYDFCIGERNVSILYKCYKEFIETIRMIIAGDKVDMHYKEWAYVGVIDDVLLLDVSSAIVLFDKAGTFAELAETLKVQYPITLKKAIIRSSERIIAAKTKGLVRFKSNPFISSVAANELVTAYVRYVYAKHELYNPGLKHVFSDSNIDFLEKDIPELFHCYQIYCHCIKSKFETNV